MAFTLPDVVLDGSEISGGLRIPKPILDASSIDTGIRLPKIYLTEATPLEFSLTMTGGIEYSGVAIVGDATKYTMTGGILYSGEATVSGEPLIITMTGGIEYSGVAIVGDATKYTMTGGILYSGEATVSIVKPVIDYYFPLGGIKYSGVATVATNFIEFKPSGGMQWGGTATVATVILLKYELEMTGGILYSGEAKDPLFYASGGILYSGEAVVTSLRVYPHTATGGMAYSGEAGVDYSFVFKSSGGIVYSGEATVIYKNPVFAPTGGILYSGEALSIFLPSGAVLTPENPTGDFFSGWAMNYETAAVSRYEDLPMTSICTFNGETFVTNAAGVYKLGRTDDAGQPIKATATILSNTDFGSKSNKRVPYIYMGYKSDYNMRITVVTNTQTYVYKDILTPTDGNRGTRAVLGRGLRGLYWTFRLSNIDGAFFELDNLYTFPVTLDRMGV